MSKAGPAKWLGVIAVWLLLAGAGYAVYRYVLTPHQDRQQAYAAAVAEYQDLARRAQEKKLRVAPLDEDLPLEELQDAVAQLKQRLTGSTAGGPLLDEHIRLALDSFSGYAVLRSGEFRRELAARNIGLELVDDGADYPQRLRTIASGDTPLAVFTIDALLKASGDELPATIVLLLDETIGADAMVAYEAAVPNIDALNRPDARLVVTPDSPSETLGRVVMADFNLPQLPENPWVPADGAADVFERFRRGDQSKPEAFVLWEPFVAKALELPGAVRLIDSSRFRGYIVDVLVVQRDYLLENEQLVQAVVESYLRALYQHASRSGGMAQLVSRDAEAAGEPLTTQQAKALVEGIWWKNTQENYAHEGLLSVRSSRGLQPLGTMIRNIASVLVKTGAIERDPTGGDPGKLYYDGILRRLYEQKFHPNVVGTGEEQIRAISAPPQLTDEQWEKLVPVGTLEVERIVFARGSSRLITQSERALNRLAETLRSWPQYYLLVQGNARRGGDEEANRRLAEARAKEAADFLVAAGVAAHRVRAVTAQTAGSGGEAQSVTFVLEQLPY